MLSLRRNHSLEWNWLNLPLTSQPSRFSARREMKRGNIGLALGMVGKKIKSSLHASVDLGLTGKDGVVHPSLTVRLSGDTFCESLGGWLLLTSSAPSASRKVQRSWRRTSVYSGRLWRACCTDTERWALEFAVWRISISSDLSSASLKLQCQSCFLDDGDLIFSSHVSFAFVISLFRRNQTFRHEELFQIHVSCILSSLEHTPCRRVRGSLFLLKQLF